MSDLSLWVAAQLGAGAAPIELAPVSGDAGFRRYYRLRHGDASYIVMDASADRAGCEPFVRIDRLLAGGGLPVPVLHAVDLERGWLLLSDLGSHTLLERLDDGNADAFYRAAIEALLRLQRIDCPADLPRYDEALLRRELALFPDWYLQHERGVALDPRKRKVLDDAFDLLVDRALAQPRVLVHRDYMPRNLMVSHGMEVQTSDALPGVLDFQDAVCGPIAYDPICLFKDAFISWPEPRVVDWLTHYWQRGRSAGLPLPDTFEAFYAGCDFIGAHRHLKVIGIFARLCHRDGKPKYLDDVPRFFTYLQGACARRAELAPLGELLAELSP